MPRQPDKQHSPRFRLYGKNKVRMPKPPLRKEDNGFTLRNIQEADSRYKAVKVMKERLAQLIEDAAIRTIQGEMLAGRAIFILGYLESMEVDAFEGKPINW